MHDARGHELHVGDLVLVPCRVRSLAPHEDFCNVELETTYALSPTPGAE